MGRFLLISFLSRFDIHLSKWPLHPRRKIRHTLNSLANIVAAIAIHLCGLCWTASDFDRWVGASLGTDALSTSVTVSLSCSSRSAIGRRLPHDAAALGRPSRHNRTPAWCD